MSSIAKQTSAPNSASRNAQPEAPDGMVAHPKIARRPSQWKRALPEGKSDGTSIPPAAASSRPTLWQEDVRFGICLMLSIIGLNIALLYLSDEKGNPAPESSLMIQQVTRAPVLPTSHTDDNAHIRLFANPAKARHEPRESIYDAAGNE